MCVLLKVFQVLTHRTPGAASRSRAWARARNVAVDDHPAFLPHLVKQVLEHRPPDPRAARAGSDGDPDVGDVEVLPLR